MAMKVERTTYPGWTNHPAYRVSKIQDWFEICAWMNCNKVEHFLLSSGSSGYVFQVRDNKEWFMLKWEN
jgi:hypothetical protein